jgi:hypothetical protein
MVANLLQSRGRGGTIYQVPSAFATGLRPDSGSIEIRILAFGFNFLQFCTVSLKNLKLTGQNETFH